MFVNPTLCSLPRCKLIKVNKNFIGAGFRRLFVCALSATLALPQTSHALPGGQQTDQSGAAGAITRRVGKVKKINATTITLTPDSGSDIDVIVGSTTRIERIAPGETDPKNATPMQLQDLQIGDLIRVRGRMSDDGKSIVASSIIALKASDVELRHQQDLQDWQKRGADGLASAVDPATGTVTISLRGKNVVVHTSAATVIRRYAPDSVKFDDAKPSTLAAVHPGDQVRARGDRSADGSELKAEEIVSGTFRNIAGTVNSVDASSSTVSVRDLLSKKTLTVKISQDSQLRQLPPEIALRFAARLKRTATGLPAAAAAPDSSAGTQSPRPAEGGGAAGEGEGARRSGGAPDFQQLLNRLPAITVNDLHKGDAVIVLSTEGTAGVGTTITLLTGVEPILQAAPNASGASILTPWSLAAPSGDSGP